MGQIISLPVLAGYPATSAALDADEWILLRAARWWVEADQRGDDPLLRLCCDFQIAGSEKAAFALDALMTIVGRMDRRPMDIRPPCCPDLAIDEQHFLHAAGHAQAGNLYLSKAALLRTLLLAEGAEAAVGPLRDLAERLAEAGLFLRKRRPPISGTAQIGTVEVWRPSARLETIRR